MVLVTDPLYDPCHAPLVARLIEHALCQNTSSRALTAVPLRDAATRSMKAHLVDLLAHTYALVLLAEGEEACPDDWGAREEEVSCWWGVWRRI